MIDISFKEYQPMNTKVSYKHLLSLFLWWFQIQIRIDTMESKVTFSRSLGVRGGVREKQQQLVRSRSFDDPAKCPIHKTNINIETPWHDLFIERKTSRVERHNRFSREQAEKKNILNKFRGLLHSHQLYLLIYKTSNANL